MEKRNGGSSTLRFEQSVVNVTRKRLEDEEQEDDEADDGMRLVHQTERVSQEYAHSEGDEVHRVRHHL